MGRNLRVLLVEDDTADVMLIEDALRAHANEVELHVAGDGLEALEHLGAVPVAARPDLILMDLNMPRMDGRALLSVLKQDEDLKAIPVVVLTTSSTPADVLGCYRDRANAYVTKPIDLDDFEHVIGSIEHFYGEIAQSPRTT